MEPGPSAESPNTGLANVAPPRILVWHATLESRKAGQASVLACAETIFAVALYWWIAIRFDTHKHLVSSVFVAPLLLLKSPESITAGVRWFRSDWIELTISPAVSRKRRSIGITATGVAVAISVYYIQSTLGHPLIVSLQGVSWVVGVAMLGTVSVLVAISIVASIVSSFADRIAIIISEADEVAIPPVIAVESHDSDAIEEAIKKSVTEIATAGMKVAEMALVAVSNAVEQALAMATILIVVSVGMIVGTIASLGWMAGVAATCVAIGILGLFVVALSRRVQVPHLLLAPLPTILSISFGVGMLIRSLICRTGATLRFAASGFRQLPVNWRENNFFTDFSLSAELMPGIREPIPDFSSDVYFRKWVAKRNLTVQTATAIMLPILFLPAVLYRLNIKATAWFWWPLAYLLKPIPTLDTASQEKQALCWPWTNPFQKAWIVVSVVLVIVSLVLHSIDRAKWVAWNKVPAIPLALKVSFAIDWQHFAPWHWAQWVIAGSGAIMLALAGNARSHDVNGNWEQYRRSSPHAITWMTKLQRIRSLATISLLVMGLGALAMQERFWQGYISLPETWIKAMERFYGLSVA